MNIYSFITNKDKKKQLENIKYQIIKFDMKIILLKKGAIRKKKPFSLFKKSSSQYSISGYWSIDLITFCANRLKAVKKYVRNWLLYDR